jgi:hypothetical protein
VEEGRAMANLEAASWLGTDLAYQQFGEELSTAGIEGYLSYPKGDSTCFLMYTGGNTPKVVFCATFPDVFSTQAPVISGEGRNLTTSEKELHRMRLNAEAEVRSNPMFNMYSNTNFNIVPMIWKGEKKVYVLTGPTTSENVIFGNDYLITCDAAGKVKKTSRIHASIIPVPATGKPGDDKTVATLHTHLPETGDYITVTDVCTLILYRHIYNWTAHYVVTKKWITIWDVNEENAKMVSAKALDKINNE